MELLLTTHRIIDDNGIGTETWVSTSGRKKESYTLFGQDVTAMAVTFQDLSPKRQGEVLKKLETIMRVYKLDSLYAARAGQA